MNRALRLERRRRFFLATEFLALYALAPLVLAAMPQRVPVIPPLWVAAAICGAWVKRQPRAGAAPRADLRRALTSILIRWVALVVGLSALLLAVYPERWLELPREQPRFWLALVVLYPVVSVIPQGVVYRSFLLRRYALLFVGETALRAAATFAFAFAHVVFRNVWAVGLTAIGGWLFSGTYRRTGSAAVAGFEQWLYGAALFTVGWHDWLLDGTQALLNRLMSFFSP